MPCAGRSPRVIQRILHPCALSQVAYDSLFCTTMGRWYYGNLGKLVWGRLGASDLNHRSAVCGLNLPTYHSFRRYVPSRIHVLQQTKNSTGRSFVYTEIADGDITICYMCSFFKLPGLVARSLCEDQCLCKCRKYYRRPPSSAA